MTTKELIREFREARWDVNEREEDWNCYFYMLELERQLKEFGIDPEEIR